MKKTRTILLSFVLLLASSVMAQTLYICRGSDVETASDITFSQSGMVLNGTIQTADVDSITTSVPSLRFVGGDISMLPKYEAQQASYKDAGGKAITDVLAFLKEQGWNTMRVRLFVDPTKTDDKKSVVQDLDYVQTLGQRIKQAGLLLMLDFHYSDTWADPSAQWTPDAWKTLTNDELYEKVYQYTKECLEQLCDAGAAPDFIQTGNEISYGMMWGTKAEAANNQNNRCFTNSPAANWTRFTTLLRRAGQACREVCPRAQIIIHSERVSKPSVMTDFFDRMKAAAVDYDIIGLSYYPYFHGNLATLETAITTLEQKNYGKRIQIVEMGYPSQWAVPGTTFDYSATYPYSEAGQQQFVADLIAMLKKHKQVNGLNWWYAEANANGTTGDLKTGWYNASLFNNNNGRALPALSELHNYK